jgi:acetylornithine/succinyldiaminopimelate/putrescine aminotransferase
MPDGFLYADFNSLDAVKSLISGRTAAVIVEAVQGEGGVVPATLEFMQGLRALCDEKGILLFCDEVQCGMGRTGKWFGFQKVGIKPDAFSVAKSLGSGYPIGGIVTSPKVADVFQPGKHASTFGASPLACSAALATIRVIEEENLLDRATEAGRRFKTGLEKFIGQYERVKGVRYTGLMVGLVVDGPVKELAKILVEMNLLTIPTGDNVIRFLPPLTVKDSEIDEALEILDDALAQWHGVEKEATE